MSYAKKNLIKYYIMKLCIKVMDICYDIMKIERCGILNFRKKKEKLRDVEDLSIVVGPSSAH
jgi:hypothetical protein